MTLWLIGSLVAFQALALAEETAPSPEQSEPVEVPKQAEEPPADTSEADLERLTRQLNHLSDLVEEQQARIDEQATTIERMNGDVLDAKLKLIPKDTFHVELEGYYRARGYLFANLFNPASEARDARYMEHRLRLRPIVNYRDLAKLGFQIDGLPGVVWGDNESLASTALFAGDPTFTGRDGRPRSSIQLSRVWTEFSVPIGNVMVGRMGSHWGMGLLANDGNGFRNTFGEARYGNTFDRVMFATKPIAIAQAITGKEGKDIPLFLAVGVDRLVEDPMIQFKGYTCEAGIYDDDPDFDPRCDVNGDGRTDQDHGFTDDSYTADNRDQTWWADQDDDVMEMIYALIYRGEGIQLGPLFGDLTAGGYAIHRIQQETDSNVLVLDAYINALLNGLAVEAELVSITGQTRGIALPGAYNTDPDADALEKQASILGYVARLGYVRPGWKLMIESGYASGDDNVSDATFSGRALHPDHNVGLLLYEEVLARVTQQVWTESADGLWSNGGVYNSRYIFPTATLSPLDNWDIIGGFLMAWPDRADGGVIACVDGEGCAQALATSSAIGWEVDLGIHHSWHEHLRLALELGYAQATDRLPLEAAGLNPEGNFFTVQSRIAWQF